MKRLSDKQLRFIELWTGVATETAELVGYSNPRQAGMRCLQNVDICRLIKEKREAEIKPEIMSRQERQKFWTDVIKAQDEDMKNKLRASELLGKSEGDFLDRIHQTRDTTHTIRWAND